MKKVYTTPAITETTPTVTNVICTSGGGDIAVQNGGGTSGDDFESVDSKTRGGWDDGGLW